MGPPMLSLCLKRLGIWPTILGMFFADHFISQFIPHLNPFHISYHFSFLKIQSQRHEIQWNQPHHQFIRRIYMSKWTMFIQSASMHGKGPFNFYFTMHATWSGLYYKRWPLLTLSGHNGVKVNNIDSPLFGVSLIAPDAKGHGLASRFRQKASESAKTNVIIESLYDRRNIHATCYCVSQQRKDTHKIKTFSREHQRSRGSEQRLIISIWSMVLNWFPVRADMNK